MIGRVLTRGELPGKTPVSWRREAWAVPVACLAGACWPPLVLTLAILPPSRWIPGAGGVDWRLLALAVGLIALPLGIRAVRQEHERTGKPSTRVGVIWRFLLMGGVLAAALQILLALIMIGLNLIEAEGIAGRFGAVETTILVYGVGGLPLALLIGVSYALWAGAIVAFVAFEKRNPVVRPRMGILRDEP